MPIDSFSSGNLHFTNEQARHSGEVKGRDFATVRIGGKQVRVEIKNTAQSFSPNRNSRRSGRSSTGLSLLTATTGLSLSAPAVQAHPAPAASALQKSAATLPVFSGRSAAATHGHTTQPGIPGKDRHALQSKRHIIPHDNPAPRQYQRSPGNRNKPFQSAGPHHAGAAAPKQHSGKTVASYSGRNDSPAENSTNGNRQKISRRVQQQTEYKWERIRRTERDAKHARNTGDEQFWTPPTVANNSGVNTVPYAQQVREEMRQAWLAQKPWLTSTTPVPPALPLPSTPVPWILQQEANGTLTFHHCAAVRLEDYALSSAPPNGTQSTPLKANAAFFTIQAPGQNSTLPGQGSLTYRVSREQFAVRRRLSMALTGPGLEPVELIQGAGNSMTVAPRAPQLLPFLSSFYAAQSLVPGSVTQNGDGLIRNSIGTWCLIDGRPFPLRTGPDGKHYIPSPDITFLSKKQRDVAGTRRLLEALQLTHVEVERRNNTWQMLPSAANGWSLLTFFAQARLYGATTESGSHTGHGFRHAGMTFPFERDVNATAGHITLPSVTDPAGIRPPVPLDWYSAAGFGGETGFYTVHSSKPDVDAVRPAMTLDTMNRWEKAGFVLKFLALAVDSPLRTIRELWGDTMGDIISRRKLWNAVLNDGWEQDNEMGTAVTSLADFTYHNLFGSSGGGLGYIASTGVVKTGLRGAGKTLMNQTLTRQEAEAMAQTVGNMRFYMQLPTGSSVTLPDGIRDRNNLPGLQSLERHLIIPALRRSPDLPYSNLFRHESSGTTWLHEAERLPGNADYPHLLERRGDLYIQMLPDGVQNHEPELYLSEESRLRLLTREEADLNRHLERVTGENVPDNLYRDSRTGWHYVRETDAKGIRTADRAVALYTEGSNFAENDWYEVPGSGEMLRVENGRLRQMTVSEMRERVAQLPSADTLNAGNFEKVYVINRDESRTVEYVKKTNKDSATWKSGRKTYRYVDGEFKDSHKWIDGNNRQTDKLAGGGPIKRPMPPDLGEPSNKRTQYQPSVSEIMTDITEDIERLDLLVIDRQDHQSISESAFTTIQEVRDGYGKDVMKKISITEPMTVIKAQREMAKTVTEYYARSLLPLPAESVEYNYIALNHLLENHSQFVDHTLLVEVYTDGEIKRTALLYSPDIDFNTLFGITGSGEAFRITGNDLTDAIHANSGNVELLTPWSEDLKVTSFTHLDDRISIRNKIISALRANDVNIEQNSAIQRDHTPNRFENTEFYPPDPISEVFKETQTGSDDILSNNQKVTSSLSRFNEMKLVSSNRADFDASEHDLATDIETLENDYTDKINKAMKNHPLNELNLFWEQKFFAEHVAETYQKFTQENPGKELPAFCQEQTYLLLNKLHQSGIPERHLLAIAFQHSLSEMLPEAQRPDTHSVILYSKSGTWGEFNWAQLRTEENGIDMANFVDDIYQNKDNYEIFDPWSTEQRITFNDAMSTKQVIEKFTSLLRRGGIDIHNSDLGNEEMPQQPVSVNNIQLRDFVVDPQEPVSALFPEADDSDSR